MPGMWIVSLQKKLWRPSVSNGKMLNTWGVTHWSWCEYQHLLGKFVTYYRKFVWTCVCPILPLLTEVMEQMYIVKGRKVYPYHTITALIPLRIEKSGLAEIVIIWLTYRICSPISKSIVCSSFFYWCLSMIVSVVFYYLESFVAFYHLFFVRCFVFSDNLDFCQMPNGFLNKTYKKRSKTEKWLTIEFCIFEIV